MKTKRLPAASNATPTAIEPAGIPIGSIPDPDEKVIELSPEEYMFVNYLFEENMNRTRAYLRVYPHCTVDSARASASRLLARVNVNDEVKRRLQDETMSIEEGIARISRIARGTIFPFIKEGPDGFMYFDLSHEDAKSHMYMVKEMETKRERRIVGSGEAAEEWEGEWVKVKLYDAYAATIDLLKLHGQFTKKVEVTGKDGAPLNEPVDHEGFSRSLNTLADAIRSIAQKDETSPTPNS